MEFNSEDGVSTHPLTSVLRGTEPRPELRGIDELHSVPVLEEIDRFRRRMEGNTEYDCFGEGSEGMDTGRREGVPPDFGERIDAIRPIQTSRPSVRYFRPSAPPPLSRELTRAEIERLAELLRR